MTGGNVSFYSALETLTGIGFTPVLECSPSEAEEAPKAQGVQEKPLTNKGLLSYLGEKRITIKTAREECTQVSYSIGDKSYYAIGFKNESGGYTALSRYYMGCVGKQDISVRNPNGSACYIFDGFTDYLSYKEVQKCRGKQTDGFCHIILNSCANVKKAVEWIKKHDYIKKIIVILGRYEAGRRASAFLIEQLGGAAEVSDGSDFLDPYRSVNEWWQGCFKK